MKLKISHENTKNVFRVKVELDCINVIIYQVILLYFDRTFLAGQVSILPIVGQVYMEGNPFVCNCSLNSFISWMQANKNNHQVNKNYNFKVLSSNIHSV